MRGQYVPEIFLSYSRDDQATARHFATELESEGFSVWWDQSLSAGEAFDQVTERALDEARAVVVLWSQKSVESRWVRAEATQGHANHRLVPVMIEACRRPIMFELTHTADLVGWKGQTADPRWQSFVEGLRKFSGAGERTTTHAATHAAPHTARHASRRLWAWLAAAAGLFIAAGLAWHFRGLAAHKQAGAEASVAVLPFVNMSADPGQDYFSDGLSEELINQLAHIDGLRVTARTSAFAFKGRAEDLRSVGTALVVAHILEGSVRKSGDRIRITAQLIDAASGYHMWSETFDRAATDVFAIQDEISAAVAARLGPSLGLAPRVSDYGGTQSFDAYDHLLRGDVEFAKSSREGMWAAAAEYRRALEIDPNYARAAAELAIALSASGFPPPDGAALREERERATLRALAIAPTAPLSLAASMWRHTDRLEWIEADAACADVLAGPRDPRAQWICGGFLSVTGRVRTALPYREAARRADPVSTNIAGTLVRQYAFLDMGPELQREFARIDGLQGSHQQAVEAMLMHLMHTGAPATQIADRVARLCPAAGEPCATLATAIRSPNQGRSLLRAQLNTLRKSNPGGAGLIALWAAYLGDHDLSIEALQTLFDSGNSAAFQNVWYPLLSQVRKDPRFKQIVNRIGYVSLWRKTGRWADSCRPLGASDFECF